MDAAAAAAARSQLKPGGNFFSFSLARRLSLSAAGWLLLGAADRGRCFVSDGDSLKVLQLSDSQLQSATMAVDHWRRRRRRRRQLADAVDRLAAAA